MDELERIAYDLGRSALADQESLVAGVQQRTGTLLAAHALVASFLGGATLREHGLSVFSWGAIVMLVAGLVAAAILLAPWRLRFALDARGVYDELQTARSSTDTAAHSLATVGFAHQELGQENELRVRWMSTLSVTLAVLMVCQTLCWVAALLVH